MMMVVVRNEELVVGGGGIWNLGMVVWWLVVVGM